MGTQDAQQDRTHDLNKDQAQDQSTDQTVDIARDTQSDLRDMQEITPREPGYPGDPIGTRSLKVLFIGNSFTHQGPVPDLFRGMATDAGWPTPNTRYVAPGGKTLSFHRTNPETLNAVDEGAWDVVVLQEFSTGATDNAGDPERFKRDMVWFYDRVQAKSPNARVVLYMTWARHPDHGLYPGTFYGPEQMQAQLRFHYNDVANRVIPTESASANTTNVVVAPVGNVWERHLNRPNALRLHATDDYHANANGQYLNALVMYGVIYNRATQGLGTSTISQTNASTLQVDVDAITGKTIRNGPAQTTEMLPLQKSQRANVDFGGQTRQTPSPWNNITPEQATLANMVTTSGQRTTTSIAITQPFAGANLEGQATNGIGWPETASSDSLWVGSFDGHQQALQKKGQLTLSNLDPQGTYTLTLFASRTGNDNGNGRLTRYVVGAQQKDVEVADNTTTTVTFDDIKASASGRVDVVVTPSPNGSSRFAYIGAMSIERTN